MSSTIAAATALPRMGVVEAALARASSARPAVVAPARGGRAAPHSYAQLLRDAVAVRRLLAARSDAAQRADAAQSRVALLMPRGYDFAASLCGAWCAGGIAVPLCTSHPPNELGYTIRDSGADTVLFHPHFAPQIDALRPEFPSVRWISSDEFPDSSAVDVSSIQLTDFDKSRGALLIYTSGTTGKPKGVFLSHRSVEAHATSLLSAWRWTSNDHILHVLPLHHTHGLVNALLCALWSGATCEFTPDTKFSAADIWSRWMEPQRDLSLFMAVPTIYAKLAAHYDTMSPEDKQRATEACSQFRLMVSGSSALPQVVAEKWRAISGHELLERYGMTEVGMALGNPIDGPRVLGEVGVPFSGVEARIVNPDTGADLTASPNEPGHLQIRGPQVFDRYWGREEATREAFSEPGHWFLTGDVACCTERGTFKILGRASVDIIKVGGYKISALDIEREILDHPDVAEVAVVGIPSTEWGERIGAIVVHKPATAGQLSLDSLRTWLASRLAPYKLPTRLLIVDEIPKNAMGKVNKKELVKLFN